MHKISIGIIDDDSLIVQLLQTFFEQQTTIDVTVTASSGDEILEILSANKENPEILLLDLRMDGTNGIDVTSKLKEDYPSIHCIVLSSYYKEASMGFMLQAGVAAFLPKDILPEQLIEAITEVSQKGFFFLPSQLEAVRNQISSKSTQPTFDNKNVLSEREIEILRLIAEQNTAREIADKLFITQRTVEGHKSNLFAKTGAKNLAGLVIYAVQHGIIDLRNIPDF